MKTDWWRSSAVTTRIIQLPFIPTAARCQPAPSMAFCLVVCPNHGAGLVCTSIILSIYAGMPTAAPTIVPTLPIRPHYFPIWTEMVLWSWSLLAMCIIAARTVFRLYEMPLSLTRSHTWSTTTLHWLSFLTPMDRAPRRSIIRHRKQPSVPVAADIDGAGNKEILYPPMTGRMHLFGWTNAHMATGLNPLQAHAGFLPLCLSYRPRADLAHNGHAKSSSPPGYASTHSPVNYTPSRFPGNPIHEIPYGRLWSRQMGLCFWLPPLAKSRPPPPWKCPPSAFRHLALTCHPCKQGALGKVVDPSEPEPKSKRKS